MADAPKTKCECGPSWYVASNLVRWRMQRLESGRARNLATRLLVLGAASNPRAIGVGRVGCQMPLRLMLLLLVNTTRRRLDYSSLTLTMIPIPQQRLRWQVRR